MAGGMMDDPRSLLRQLEQRARRRFGQHFLTDVSVPRRMVKTARVEASDRVVEIGPGLGILTGVLLETGAEVLAIEVDRDLAGFLRVTHPDLNLVERDVLKVDWDELCPGEGWKVVANLPYNIGTTVLMRLLRRPRQFASVTVMLQLEVVQRLFAEPGSKAYNALSLEAQVRGKPYWVSKLGPDAFFPPPKVSSAVVRFELYDAPKVGDVPPAYFDRVVRAAFSQWRKNIVNSLGSVFGKDRVRAIVTSMGVNPSARAEQLDVDLFRAFALALHREEQAVKDSQDTSET
jgi:16S rRNA (adenine1518-N6/adenine1519-N6)-dimethyltransferase